MEIRFMRDLANEIIRTRTKSSLTYIPEYGNLLAFDPMLNPKQIFQE